MPQYTNKYNLPLPLHLALIKNDYDKCGDYSVTEAIGPVKIGILKERHNDEIVMDSSDLMWMMRGNSMHHMAEMVTIPGAIQEQRIMFDFMGKQISMKADIIYPSEKNKGKFRLLDYKDTKVFVAKHGMIKDEWVWQDNLYRIGYERQYGIKIEALENALLLGDWKWIERYVKYAKQDENAKNKYPDIPMHIINVPIKDDDLVLEYLRERINLIEDNKLLTDDNLPDCTLEERWGSNDVFAVVGTKSGNAVPKGGKFIHKDEAIAFQEARWVKAEVYKQDGTLRKSTIQRGDTHIEYRKGESKRCERGYCPVRNFCKQYITTIRKDPF